MKTKNMDLALEARKVTGFTQEQFCTIFGLSLHSQQKWEQQCKVGSGMSEGVKTYLELIKAYPLQIKELRDGLALDTYSKKEKRS